MGLYSSEAFDSVLNTYNIQEVQGYDDDSYSAQLVMIESAQNNLAIFEGSIMCDIQEASMRNAGVDEEEILLFSENVLTSMLGKIKEFLKKVWAKIKAIFKGFMARFDSVFMKSNKQFVNKYKDVILKKDLTDFEVKWRKWKGTDIKEFPAGDVDKKCSTYAHISTPKDELEKWDEDKYLEEILNKTLNGNTVDSVSTYDKDFIDSYFEDEDNDDKIDIHDIMTELIGLKDIQKNAKKSNDSLNKAFSNMVKTIEKDEHAFIKLLPGKGEDGKWTGGTIKHKTYSIKGDRTTGYESDVDDTKINNQSVNPIITDNDDYDNAKPRIENYQKAISLVHKWAVLYQTAATKYTSAVMKALKLRNSETRKVWAKAVAYNRKKDESVMMEAMAELALYEEDVA